MSGTLRHRVNQYWSCSTNSIAPSVFFWHFLNFVNDHPNLDFKGYGTGKAASGVTPPAGWINWDPDTTPTPPMSDNSWFVFEAVNADNALDGGGLNPWQAKIQFTNSTGFDDCNVADADYTQEGTTYICCMRVSVTGGWDNVTALDFVVSEDISNNYIVLKESLDGKFFLDIVGDDDTIWWNGACFDGGFAESGSRSRGGCVGMYTRRSSIVDYPFFFMARALEDTTANIFTCVNSWNFPGDRPANNIEFPNFSLWNDGTAITVHRLETWNDDARYWMTKDYVTGGDVVLGCLLHAADSSSNRYAILGEIRLFGSTWREYAQGTLVGESSDWKQVCYQAESYGGMLMKWPPGIAPIWPV